MDFEIIYGSMHLIIFGNIMLYFSFAYYSEQYILKPLFL